MPRAHHGAAHDEQGVDVQQELQLVLQRGGGVHVWWCGRTRGKTRRIFGRGRAQPHGSWHGLKLLTYVLGGRLAARDQDGDVVAAQQHAARVALDGAVGGIVLDDVLDDDVDEVVEADEGAGELAVRGEQDPDGLVDGSVDDLQWQHLHVGGRVVRWRARRRAYQAARGRCAPRHRAPRHRACAHPATRADTARAGETGCNARRVILGSACRRISGRAYL